MKKKLYPGVEGIQVGKFLNVQQTLQSYQDTVLTKLMLHFKKDSI
jgi:hypothetical protein